MFNSTQLSLVDVSQQVVIYIGFFLFVAGLIGNPLTLIVFLSLQTFRQSSCAFYLIVMSFVNTFHLFTGLFTYVLINGFGINWLNMSLFYCKFRSFNVQVCILTSYSCMCLATIDQFLATCSHARWQQLSNIKLARYLLTGIATIWILLGIPFLICYGHIVSTKTTCAITNVIFQRYYDVFHLPFLMNAIPSMIMILFGILAYRNVQHIAYRTVPLVRRELDRQLTTMVLVQVFYNTIAVIPGTITGIFNIISGAPTDPVLSARATFISRLVTMMYYFNYMGSFYIYVCVSKRFRQQLIYVLFTIHFNRFHPGNNNQVEPQA